MNIYNIKKMKEITDDDFDAVLVSVLEKSLNAENVSLVDFNKEDDKNYKLLIMSSYKNYLKTFFVVRNKEGFKMQQAKINKDNELFKQNFNDFLVSLEIALKNNDISILEESDIKQLKNK